MYLITSASFECYLRIVTKHGIYFFLQLKNFLLFLRKKVINTNMLLSIRMQRRNAGVHKLN